MSTIHVPFQYAIEGKLKRERNASLKIAHETVAVEIRDLSSSEVAGRIRIPHSMLDAKSGFPIVDGRIYATTYFARYDESLRREFAVTMTPETTRSIYRDHDTKELYSSRSQKWSPFYDLPYFDPKLGDAGSKTSLPKMVVKAIVRPDTEWTERIWDDRDERMTQAVRNAASDTVCIDGNICTALREPFWMDSPGEGWERIWWHSVRNRISEIAVQRCHLPIDARRTDLVAAQQPTGDVGMVETRMPKDRIRLSRLLQNCASLVFPNGAQEEAFAGSGAFQGPDVHADLDDAVRSIRRVVRSIDAATAPADPRDDLSPFGEAAASALRSFEDAVSAHGFHRGNPKRSLDARRILETIPRIAASLDVLALSGPSTAIDWAEDQELEGFSM